MGIKELFTILKSVYNYLKKEYLSGVNAWNTLSILVCLLVFLPIFPDSRIKALGDLFSLFYIGMAGVVSAYFGAAAFMARKK